MPVNLIVDTDMSIDVDDVGALCAAHALADLGEAKLLAVIHDTALPEGAGAISVINNFYGRDHLRIGAYSGNIGDPSKTPEPAWTSNGEGEYVHDLVETFKGSRVRTARDAERAVDVYRETLAATWEPHSITIAAIGHTTALLELLQSPADDVGPSGIELVQQKVRQVSVAGFEP